MIRICKISVLLFLFLCLPTPGWALPAFPGAEGFGADTIGGRGGRVIEVVNLNAKGSGSFVAAVAAQGPRIVVFRIGGTIVLTNDVMVTNPYLTIAAQTAPGGGIALRGAALRINTHDVIVRGLRIRVGDGPGPNPDNRDALGIQTNLISPTTYNIIVDHCSLSWAIDENTSIYGLGHDISYQWNIISEGLYQSLATTGPGGRGFLAKDKGAMRNISMHHNLLAHNLARNPELAGDPNGDNTLTGEIINNISYNWVSYCMRLEHGLLKVNVIGNICKAGVDSHATRGLILENDMVTGTAVYVSHNLGPNRPTDSGDDWLFVSGPSSYRVNSPAFVGSGITTESPAAAYASVLDKAGAIVPTRDSSDLRVVDHVRNGTGHVIDSQAQVGGWPVLAPGTPLQDTDHDGMPDSWETAHGLNLNNSADGKQDRDGDGYTNVEEYLNSLLATGTIITPPAPTKRKWSEH